MINFNISIIKKEFKSYFNSPIAYIIIIVFLLLWEFLFFRSVFLVGEASLRILFSFLPWLFLLLIPAITMGSISQEKSEGTLEFLLTHPIKDKKLILEKFLASIGFTSIILLFIFPIAISLSSFGNLDWGIVFGQYFASLLMASVLIAMGIFISSLFASQISSLLVSTVSSFFLIIAGLEIVTASLPLFLASLFERLSVLSHFNSMSRGVIDFRDIWYFLSITLVFLSLAYLQLLKRRFGNQKLLYNRYKSGIILFIGITMIINIAGLYIPGRIDLTQDKLYTLTSATKKTLGELNDVVNITLFASDHLPASFQPVLRNIKDTLRDYQIFGKGNIVLINKNPSRNPQTAQEASDFGIQEVQFNVVEQEEFKLKNGYLGLAVSYGDEHESIPFVQDTRDLEYQLTSFIKQLTTTTKNKIGFISGYGEKNIFTDYRLFYQELQKQFDIEIITADSEELIPENMSALVIAGPTQEIGQEMRFVIKKYLENQGSALFLIDQIIINPQFLSVEQNENSFSDFLKNYGIDVLPDIVYDTRSNETVGFGGGGVNFFLPYPFWARVIASKLSPVTSRLESIVLPWASTLKIDEAILQEKGLSASTLFSTTRFGGTQIEEFSINPQQQLPKDGLGEQITGISLVGENTRIIALGDSEFLLDQFTQKSPENLAFGIEAVSWLSQEESLAGIKIKQQIERKLLFEDKTQIMLVKYGNMLIAFLLPAGFGLFQMFRRKNLRKFTYSAN